VDADEPDSIEAVLAVDDRARRVAAEQLDRRRAASPAAAGS
jgi:hypothetical protein